MRWNLTVKFSLGIGQKIYSLLQRLQLYFIVGKIGEKYGCRNNNISIYDGYDTVAPLKGRLCGPIRHQQFLMTHNEAFVTLSSDGSMMNTHFMVDYVAYEPVEGKKY